MNYLLAVDLETTGLIPGYHEIIQIGIILLNKELQILSSYQSLVQPQYPERGIENKIVQDNKVIDVYEYTGLSPKKLKEALPINSVLASVEQWITSKTKLKINEFKLITLFGQNTQFDISFLKEAYKHIEDKVYPFDYHNIDLTTAFTMYYLTKFDTLPTQSSLKYMCDHFETINIKEHNAMSDIQMTLAIFKCILNQLSIENQEGK